MKSKKLVLAVLVLFVAAGMSYATITFVNATADNTEAVTAGWTDPWHVGDSVTPPQWRDRNASFACWTADEGAYAGNETLGLGVNDYLMIKTTMTTADGLAAGTQYNVYLYFNGNAGWSIMGGLSEAGIEGFSDVNRTIGANDHIGANDASGRVELVGGGYKDATYRALLGVATATVDGIVVYIDDPDNSSPAGALDANRCWYDGVGFEAAVVPEPATMALLGLGVLGLLRRKK